MTKKIILDTDPGIDDAMAIIFAEASPDLELKALTTVYGNTDIDNAINNALYLKEKYQLAADVVKGASLPLSGIPKAPVIKVHGETGFGYIKVAKQTNASIDSRSAAQYIIDAVKAEPGEITLVAVGPLTNLALALQDSPEITALVKEVVIMGAAFGMNEHRGNVTPYAEANIHADPQAADLVFAADWPVTVIGLDVTKESLFTEQYLTDIKDSTQEVGQFIWDISQYYLEFYAQITGSHSCHVHDPSAIAYVISPSLFTFREGPINAITSGPAIGHTIQKFDQQQYMNDPWSPRRSHQVGASVQSKQLLALYKKTIIDYDKALSNKNR
ncbi:nucleoside hydrolase [Shewanella surugensis]|uniref:Nucleoside hydrolase n=1 Tax=Shewanella surugensis TaxID=212020 RepID=A0ABT0L9P9_9GAMM|nr:nucleoside hydrolase [Shewanella surugensis]MCL1124406.1 nucleoside hydrolase [Shewanella surugensis]